MDYALLNTLKLSIFPIRTKNNWLKYKYEKGFGVLLACQFLLL